MDDKCFIQISSVDNLLEAWKIVKEKGSSGGIDNISVTQFEEQVMDNIKLLHTELVNSEYIPDPYKHIEIRKNETEKRPLGLLTVKDKIVQTAVKLVIEPEIDKGFYHCSYAYRKSKNTLMAIHKVKNLIHKEQKQWFVLCDIDNFFDTISHNLLLRKLEQRLKSAATIELIRVWLKMGRVDTTGAWTDRVTGVPQGAILSPLFSNFYLHPFDGLMLKHKVGYVRYADDFVMLANKKADAMNAMESAKWFLTQKLLLKLNENPRVVNIAEGFEFLGISFRGNEISVSQNRKEGLLTSLENSFIIRNNGKIDPGFFTVLMNIREYYGKILPQPILEEIDERYVKILTTKLAQARQDKLIPTKKAMMDTLLQVRFFSHELSGNRFEMYKSITDAIFNKNIPAPVVTPADVNVTVSTSVTPEPKKPGDAVKSETKLPSGSPPDPNNPKEYITKDIPEHGKTSSDPAEAKIARKRREYQKLESAGMELVVSNPGIFAGISQNRIVLKKEGRVIHSMLNKNLKNISIISDGIAISSNLIRFCADNDIAMHFLNHNGTPFAQFTAPAFVAAKIGIAQLSSLQNPVAFTFIKASITGKIKNQVNLLKYYYKYRKISDPDFTLQFDAKIASMLHLQQQLDALPTFDLAQYRQQVFTIEGQAAAIYWSLIKTLLDDDVEFPGRIHQDATDIVNMMINYGYGILYSRVWQALLHAGLNPYISYLHSSERNQPGLVFDFIEEFRQQAVDRAIIAMITKGEEYLLKDGQLHYKTRKRLAEKVLERLNSIETFRGKPSRLSNIIQIQAENLCRLITGKASHYKPYVAKW